MTAPLSPRQQDVVDLLVSGLSNKAIALKLNLSVRSVEEYIIRICRRINGAGTGKPRLRIIRWHFSTHGV